MGTGGRGARDAAWLTFDVRVWMEGDGSTQALSLALQWSAAAVEPVAQRADELLDAQGGPSAFLGKTLGAFDTALLGRRARGISGQGVLATVTFRVVAAGEPGISLRKIVARNADNHNVTLDGSVHTGTPETLAVPRVTSLHQNFPNPFNPTTTLTFGLARAGHVTLRVYSIDGRLVRTLVNDQRPAGTWSVTWDGRDSTGRRVSSGAYLATLVAPDRVQTRRMALVK